MNCYEIKHRNFVVLFISKQGSFVMRDDFAHNVILIQFNLVLKEVW